jgi:Mn2+/Fe2+ NRAMP family transporter
VNSRPLATVAWVVAVMIISLNAWLLIGTFRTWI